MNKTISINLGGSVFNIEERAYDQLKAYLDQIRKNLEEPEMSDEVMSDIELRIAELFKERMTAIKNVVVDEDVEHIITVMGRPEDYGSGHKGEQSEYKRHDHRYDNQGHKSRRIFRDSDDAIVGGVCSGLSHYIGWDPLVLRVQHVARHRPLPVSAEPSGRPRLHWHRPAAAVSHWRRGLRCRAAASLHHGAVWRRPEAARPRILGALNPEGHGWRRGARRVLPPRRNRDTLSSIVDVGGHIVWLSSRSSSVG